MCLLVRSLPGGDETFNKRAPLKDEIQAFAVGPIHGCRKNRRATAGAERAGRWNKARKGFE